MRENAPVMSVLFKAAAQAGTQLTLSSALFEVVENLKIGMAHSQSSSCPCMLVFFSSPCLRGPHVDL